MRDVVWPASMLRLMKMNELNEEKLRKKGYNLKRKIMNGLVNDGMCMQILCCQQGGIKKGFSL